MLGSHRSAVFLALCLVARAAHGQVDVGVALRTNGAASALGTDDRAPRFSWRLVSRARGVRQHSYRVVVASSREEARAGRGDVWDSGRVVSPDPWTVYAGPPLRSRTAYYWAVRVWTSPDGPGTLVFLPSPFDPDTYHVGLDSRRKGDRSREYYPEQLTARTDETRAAAIDHLDVATGYPAGSPEERYHSSAAASLAQIYAADSNRQHAAAVENAARVQTEMIEAFNRLMAQPQPEAPAEEQAAAGPSGDR